MWERTGCLERLVKDEVTNSTPPSEWPQMWRAHRQERRQWQLHYPHRVTELALLTAALPMAALLTEAPLLGFSSGAFPAQPRAPPLPAPGRRWRSLDSAWDLTLLGGTARSAGQWEPRTLLLGWRQNGLRPGAASAALQPEESPGIPGAI